MKNNAENIMNALGEVDDRFIEKTAPKMAAKRRSIAPAWIAAAACGVAAVGIGIGVIGCNAFVGGKTSSDVDTGFSQNEELDTFRVTMGLCTFGERSYTLNAESAFLPGDSVGEKLGSAQASFYSTHEDGEQPNVLTADVYAVKGFSAECAIAVATEEGYVPMLCGAFAPATLKEFAEGYNLAESGKVARVHYYPGGSYTLYETPDNAVIELLLKNPDIAVTQSDLTLRQGEYFAVDIDIPLLKAEGMSYLRAEVCANGYMWLYGPMSAPCGMCFVGEDTAAALKDCLAANGSIVETVVY